VTKIPLALFSDPQWLKANAFQALAEISSLLIQNENAGREALIRTLEFRAVLEGYQPIVTALVQRAGLYPYTSDPERLSTADLLNFEFHKVVGLDEIVLHSVQGQVYRALLDGANVILSAPTSFGKSLLIDAMVASRRFARIVVIVPTIALIDETRRRLSARFSPEFKVITHPSQEPAERNIYVLTQERFLEFPEMQKPDFFVLDEFYKLSPSRGDERTFVLNEAFYKLFKSGSQFFLIGPNVKDISVDQKQLSFRYFGTDFATVATEVTWVQSGDEMQNALAICASLTEPTLIFCKSAPSAYELAEALIEKGIITKTQAASEFATWLRGNFHPDWNLAKFLDAGIAVHHGGLPRAVAYQVLRKFNDGEIRFLLCTSTIIEGVNTAAKETLIKCHYRPFFGFFSLWECLGGD
jgi:replicative superfamily II helicase